MEKPAVSPRDAKLAYYNLLEKTAPSPAVREVIARERLAEDDHFRDRVAAFGALQDPTDKQIEKFAAFCAEIAETHGLSIENMATLLETVRKR